MLRNTTLTILSFVTLVMIDHVPAKASGCLNLEATRRISSGTYYNIYNSCGHNVWLKFVAGYDSTGRMRSHKMFVGKGATSTFIYDPQPPRYSWEKW